jgi:hypothetical protein
MAKQKLNLFKISTRQCLAGFSRTAGREPLPVSDEGRQGRPQQPERLGRLVGGTTVRRANRHRALRQEGGYIGLHLDLKIRTLSGSSLNDIPILNNRQFTGDVTVRQGETAMMTSSMTDQESKAIDGIPDLSELPGFQTVTSGGDHEKDADELLVLVTPHMIRRRRASLAGPIILLPFHVGEVER